MNNFDRPKDPEIEEKWPIYDFDKSYWPKELKNINDPPDKLRIRGNLPPPNNLILCVVGPRKYTEYGEAVCKKLISEISGYPISIVSGLAFGIDSIAHKTAIENNMHVIALPGSGLSDAAIYPRSQLNFATKIMDSGGCLISEYTDNFCATNWSFPRRNRIMVGISRATLIIEAHEKSGTMITAKLTVDYSHDVLAVPGSIFSQSSIATNSLIKDGAVLIQSAKDIIEYFGLKEIQKDKRPCDLSDIEIKILGELNDSMTIDELLDKQPVSISEINAAISSLEIKGLVTKVGDKICKK